MEVGRVKTRPACCGGKQIITVHVQVGGTNVKTPRSQWNASPWAAAEASALLPSQLPKTEDASGRGTRTRIPTILIGCIPACMLSCLLGANKNHPCRVNQQRAESKGYKRRK